MSDPSKVDTSNQSNFLEPEAFRQLIGNKRGFEFYTKYGIYVKQFHNQKVALDIIDHKYQVVTSPFVTKIEEDVRTKLTETSGEMLLEIQGAGFSIKGINLRKIWNEICGLAKKAYKFLPKIFNSLTIFYIFVTTSILLFGHTNLQQYTIALLHGCKAAIL